MKITLVPIAGLCNRMRAVVSAMAWQKNNPEVGLEIFWGKDFDCSAFFDDLFEQPKDLEIKRLKNFYMKKGGKRNFFIPDIIKKFHYDKILYTDENRRQFFEKEICNVPNIYIAAYNYFTPYEITNSLAEIFVPKEELRNRIFSITDNYRDNVIGIHIRRTDNLSAIKDNPNEKFFTLMDQEIQQNTQCQFYLATDSAEIKSLMIQRYGERIISQDLSLTRKNTIGMKDAVVDLYCLGATKKIIGCTHSTYSIMASQLYNIKLIK